MKFSEWIVRRQYPEMVGTGAVYDGTKDPDFNWWGAPESAVKPKKKKHKKNEGYSSLSRAQSQYDNMSPYDDEMDCPECEGNGEVEGIQECRECEGSGLGETEGSMCPVCKGQKEVQGMIECETCQGSGVVSRSAAKQYAADNREWDD